MIKYSKTAPRHFAAFHRFSVIFYKPAHPNAPKNSKKGRSEGIPHPDFTQLKIFGLIGFSLDCGKPQAYNPRQAAEGNHSNAGKPYELHLSAFIHLSGLANCNFISKQCIIMHFD